MFGVRLMLLACVVSVTQCRRAEAAVASRLCGQVFERGSAAPLAGATVSDADGEPTLTDDQGRFCLQLAAGSNEVAVTRDGYAPLHLVEVMPEGIVRTVEYRLLPAANTPRYLSVVRGSGVHEGERFTLRDEELQTAPGTGGDPLRVIASLPGVVAPIPILPIYVVRGGSPGMNGFFLDGMRVPQLFHMVFVEGVVHPRMLDRLDFYPGGFDATFGRVGSGVVDAATRPGRTDAPARGEFELRLYDTSALIETRIPGGVAVLIAGRYGYPGPILGAVEPGVNLVYWDYQLRVDWKGLTLEALGSHDELTLDPQQQTLVAGASGSFLVEFHRLQLREQYRRGRFELEAAIVGGVDKMALFSGQGVQKLSLAARVNARYKVWWLALAAGAEVEASRFSAERFISDDNRSAPDELGDLAGARAGVVGGGYAQASLSLDKMLHRPAAITAGVRTDVYHAGATTLLGVDPRVLVRYSPLRLLELFGAFGQYTQAPSFPVPLPGIDTFALQLGLQKAVQGSLGFRLNLPKDLSVSVTGYYGKFSNINDVTLDFQASLCTSPPPESVKGVSAYVTRQVSGAGYGMELLVRRSKGRVTGWLAYTLSRAERVFSCGLAPADFDQAHVLNAVVQVHLPWRLLLGFRLNVASGRPYTQVQADGGAGMPVLAVRNNERMPTYVQVDLRLDREWIFRRWAIAGFLELLNLTYSQSVYGVTYLKDPALMVTRYDRPQFQGFRWIIPSIGVRARF